MEQYNDFLPESSRNHQDYLAIPSKVNGEKVMMCVNRSEMPYITVQLIENLSKQVEQLNKRLEKLESRSKV